MCYLDKDQCDHYLCTGSWYSFASTLFAVFHCDQTSFLCAFLQEIGWMEALSAVTNMAGVGLRVGRLKPGFNLHLKWTESRFITRLKGATEIMNTATFSSPRMSKRSDDWWERIVREFFSEWLANFRVRLPPGRQESLTNENTEYWVHTLLAEMWPPTEVAWHHTPSHFDCRWGCACVCVHVCVCLHLVLHMFFLI